MNSSNNLSHRDERRRRYMEKQGKIADMAESTSSAEAIEADEQNEVDTFNQPKAKKLKSWTSHLKNEIGESSESTSVAEDEAIDDKKQNEVDAFNQAKPKKVNWYFSQLKDNSMMLWLTKHGHMTSIVTIEDVTKMIHLRTNNLISLKGVTSRVPTSTKSIEQYLSPYLDLQKNKDLPSTTCIVRDGTINQCPRFIAEGTETIRLLIQQLCLNDTSTTTDDGGLPLYRPKIQIESVFLKRSLFFDQPVQLQKDVELLLEQYQKEQRNAPFQIIFGSDEVLSAVAGYTVSRGCLACGYIPMHYNEEWLFYYLKHRHLSVASTTTRILALDGINDTSNLGSMIRTASAFGIHVIVLSNDCCNEWYRRTIRVSMGHIFRIPIVRVVNLARTIQEFQQEPFNITSYAAVVDTNTNLVLNQMKSDDVPNRWCCVLGNESTGVSKDVITSCSYTIKVDMEVGVDSLSVPIAAGVLLHGLRERENKIEDNPNE